MNRDVYIVTGKNPILKKILKKRLKIANLKKRSCFWIYLGKEIFLSKKIEEIIGSSAERLNIGEDLQAIAGIYRQDYIDYVGKLSLENDSPVWFLTSLSEKNPFVSDVFLHFCYVKICQKYLAENTHDLIIICENRGILDVLRTNLQSSSLIPIEFYDSRLDQSVNHIATSCIRLKNKFVFLSRFLSRVALAKIFSVVMRHSAMIKDKDPVIIMHSWTDSRSFPQKSVYKEVYFGDVGDDLERDGKEVFYLAEVLPTLWYPKALYNLLYVNKKIYLMEEFLSFREVIASLVFVYRNYPKSVKNPYFDDIDMSALISFEFKKDTLSFRAEQSYLNYFISQKIRNRFSVRSFLFTFENHIGEKAFCEGFKKNPGTKTIGYAIVFINRMYICYSLSHFEKKISPLPDVIIVSGNQGKENLIKFGFDPKKITIGGAIRYPHIRHSVRSSNLSDKKNILIALSGAINPSLELIYTSMSAFSEMRDLNILIKCHPTVPLRLLSRYLPDLPEHFHVVDSSIDELLNVTDLLVYTESTVSVEAFAKGIPILHVKSEFSIDINIFDGMNVVPSSANPGIIGKLSRELLQNKKISPPENLVENFFSLVNKNLIKKIILDDANELQGLPPE